MSKTFAAMPLSDALKSALHAAGFETPTPVQAQTIPLALKGKDILGSAHTGTGKTLAFLIPIFEKLNASPDSRAVVLVPTRELGAQVHDVYVKISAALGLAPSVLLIGGVPMPKQHRALENPDVRVMVATPGRLIDHLKHRSVSLENVKTLVLDEADRMVDMGFGPQLDEILRYVTANRQTLMFTATMGPAMKRLTENYLRHPERVAADPAAQAKGSIQRKVMELESHAKNDAILDVMMNRDEGVLIFARTQHRADRLFEFMESYGFRVAKLHGGLAQGARTRALQGFRDGEFRVLVATDVAARGLDIDHVGLVINYDLPSAPEDFVHRIGRTGRAGRTGEALSFVTPEDRGVWRQIQKLMGDKLDPLPAKLLKPSSAGKTGRPTGKPQSRRHPPKYSQSRGGTPKGGSSPKRSAKAKRSR